MKLLFRYLLRQNLFLILVILLVGTGLYILTDMFERLDNFLESGLGLLGMLYYFAVKTPTIISLILPAVYLMALVVQMNFLERSRELVALASGGVSPAAVARFVFVYGLVWALAQFLFAQVIGVNGERVAARIWQQDVRGNVPDEVGLKGLWFTEERFIVHIGVAYPVKRMGNNITVYALDDSRVGIEAIYKAERFTVNDAQGWTLKQGQQLIPARYAAESFELLDLPISQDLRAFQISSQAGVKPSQLTLQELDDTIARLEKAGSNVESLRTAWHGKLAYACSIVVMGVLALIVARLTGNIYKATVLSVLIVFFYYATNTICLSMGEKGLLSPFAGAWFANCVFFFGGLLWLSWPGLMRKIRGTG